MKKTISLLIVFAMMLSMMSALMPTSFAAEATTDTVVSGGLTGNSFLSDKATHDVFIAEAEKYVSVSNKGLMVLNLPRKVRSMISAEEYDALLAGIDYINNMISEGALAVTENCTIFETNDAELVVQGGNVNKVTWHWWGMRRYASRSNANNLAYKLSSVSNYSGMVSAVATALATGLPSATAKLVSGFVAAVAGFLWAYCSQIANSINYYNKSSGVIIDLRWILTYRVRSQ